MKREDFFEKVKEFEGCHLSAYECPSGVLTIGYGHTHGVLPNMVISNYCAEFFLMYDIFLVEQQLFCVHRDFEGFSQGLKYALTDFVFNLGISHYKRSHLREVVDEVSHYKKFDDACRKRISVELQKWCFSKGKKLKGLEKRRNWEVSLLYED